MRDNIKENIMFAVAVALVVAICLLAYITPSEQQNKKDLINEQAVQKLIEQRKPGQIKEVAKSVVTSGTYTVTLYSNYRNKIRARFFGITSDTIKIEAGLLTIEENPGKTNKIIYNGEFLIERTKEAYEQN